MKKLYLLTIILFFAIASKAQITYTNYLDSTVEWKSYGQGWDGIQMSVQYETKYFDGDTLINTNYYYKVYSIRIDTIFAWTGARIVNTYSGQWQCYVREDSTGKVYTYNGVTNTETIDWDWQNFRNLMINDTFPVLGSNCTIYTIDTLYLGTKPLKQCHGNSPFLPNSVLEGVGILGQLCAVSIEGSGYVACYSRQNNSLQFSNINCNVFPSATRINHMTSIKEVPNLNQSIRVFPNPSSNQTTISYSQLNNEGDLLIYNTLGKLVYEEKLAKASSQKEINIQSFRVGLYKVIIREKGELKGQVSLVKN